MNPAAMLLRLSRKDLTHRVGRSQGGRQNTLRLAPGTAQRMEFSSMMALRSSTKQLGGGIEHERAPERLVTQLTVPAGGLPTILLPWSSATIIVHANCRRA